jgi:hypothetical protein
MCTLKQCSAIYPLMGRGEIRIENLELSLGHPNGAQTGPPTGPPSKGRHRRPLQRKTKIFPGPWGQNPALRGRVLKVSGLKPKGKSENLKMPMDRSAPMCPGFPGVYPDVPGFSWGMPGYTRMYPDDRPRFSDARVYPDVPVFSLGIPGCARVFLGYAQIYPDAPGFSWSIHPPDSPPMTTSHNNCTCRFLHPDPRSRCDRLKSKQRRPS